MRPGLLILLSVALCGCVSSQRYEVKVLNKTDSLLAVGLVKRGQPLQGWDGPEHVAIHAPQLAERRWGVLVPPGKGVGLGPQDAPPGATVYLRAYAGDHTVDELMGYRQGDPDRLDEPIYPGANLIIIEYRAGRLEAQMNPASQPK